MSSSGTHAPYASESLNLVAAVDWRVPIISPTDASLFIDGQQIATTNGTYNVTLKIGQTYRTEVTSPGYETSKNRSRRHEKL